MKSTAVKIIKSYLLCMCLIQPLHAELSNTQIPAKQTLTTLDELKVALEKIRIETNTPAIGIAVVNEDGPIWVAGLGEANIENHTPANENSVFRIGSASKILMGLSVLKLVESGKLRLDDKLRDVAPEIAFDNPWEASNPILISHLLEHTTGWQQRPAEYANDAPDSMSLKEILADPVRIKARSSHWVPGSRHVYNNIGPVVAAYVIEKISHQKYEDFVQEHFFTPLKMNSSTFFKTNAYLQHAAIPYVGITPQTYALPYSRPSSSLNSSPKDMAQLLQFFIHKGTFNNHSILTPESIHAMQKSKTTLGAQYGIASSYGLTTEIYGAKNTVLYGHGGGLPGASTAFIYIPHTKTGFAIMLTTSNANAFGRAHNLVIDYLLQDVRTEPLQPTELPIRFQQLNGFYSLLNPSSNLSRIKSDIDSTLKFSVSNNRLHREPFWGGWKSDDYATNAKNLTDSFTGLPNIAVVHDPLAGESVQVGGALYQPVSAIKVYGRVALLLSLLIMSATSILFAMVWIPRNILGRIKSGESVQLRSLPLIASMCLILAGLAPAIFGDGVLDIARLSATSASIFLLSIIYPLIAIYSVWLTYKYRAKAINKWVYWHSTLAALAHLLFTLYIATYGLIGLRLWV